MGGPLRLIGIDPGLRHTGWGIIESEGSRLVHIANGTIRPEVSVELAERLRQLFKGLQEVLTAYKPGAAAVEKTFVNKDANATLKLGQARGVLLLAPALAGLEVAEYAPNQVKKAVVGAGHAGKGQIKMMVEMLLPGCHPHSDDAADALAIAITHAHRLPLLERERKIARAL
ncbi:MAG TPA: crossover junction endodeoxyribonuclease RuvC [Rhizobiales bacterium]|nr:crossover junction endodeoxyribonuclease RuvC [Hyphomicrobiales bacterium]